ncbi:MAG: hypothetical protein ACI9IT_002452 [Glaciecola sp.]|mgnify:FL=1|jgi:hypothetical protein
MYVSFLTRLSDLEQDVKLRAAGQYTGCLSHNFRFKIISRTVDHQTKYCGTSNDDTIIPLGIDAFLPHWYLKLWKTQAYSVR